MVLEIKLRFTCLCSFSLLTKVSFQCLERKFLNTSVWNKINVDIFQVVKHNFFLLLEETSFLPSVDLLAEGWLGPWRALGPVTAACSDDRFSEWLVSSNSLACLQMLISLHFFIFVYDFLKNPLLHLLLGKKNWKGVNENQLCSAELL